MCIACACIVLYAFPPFPKWNISFRIIKVYLFYLQNKEGHHTMYQLNTDSGLRMDLVRCDGDKGMEGLPNQYGCSFHKFGNFRKRRKLNGASVPAFIRGRNNDKGPHPGLALFQNACREMVTTGQNYWLDLLVEKHGDPSQEPVFR